MSNLDLSSKSVLVYDSGGLFVSLAEVLANQFGRVGYFCPWENSFPDGRELIIGFGLSGVERVKYFDAVYGQYDLIVFPDVWAGDLQDDLRRRGHRVWGSGMRGAELELARWNTRQQFPDLGLDSNHATRVTGTKALREFLRDHPKQYVKVSAFRGLGETWHAESAEVAEPVILDFEAKHGELSRLISFICEDEIPDATEVGYDGFSIDGQFANTALFGIEKKDKSYFGAVVKYDSLPESVRDVNNRLAPLLKETGYRQFFSTEIREKGDKRYVIDLTARHASPAGEVFVQNATNLGEILYMGAEGVMVDPNFESMYGSQIMLCSDWAEEKWQAVYFPEEIRSHVKLYNHCRVDGVDWVVPQIAKMKQIGSVVAFANSPQESVDKCKDIAKQVHGFDIESEEDSLDGAMKEMMEMLSEGGSGE